MSAEEDIRKTIAQFANSFDLNDWTLLESSLANALTVDYTDLRENPPKDMTAHEYAENQRQALDGLYTQHVIGNLEIAVDGQRADVRASGVIFRASNDASFNTHARFVFGVSVDQDRGWVIDRIEQTVLWSEGNPDIQSEVKKQRTPRRLGF